MVCVYIRRRKKILFFYTRRRRGFGVQEPSLLISSNGISSLKEEVQNNGAFSSVDDLVDTGLKEGLPALCISQKNQLAELLSVQENSEIEFESHATSTKRELLDNFVLSAGKSSHEDVIECKMPVDIGLNNNEPLLSVIQQLPSTVFFRRKPRSDRKSISFDSRRRSSGLINNECPLSFIEQLPSTKCLQRRPRSARKHTSFASWKQSTIECNASDNSKQMASFNLHSLYSLQRRPRSARKPTSFASRRQSTIECSASDNSKQMASCIGASTSVSYEFSPKTPIKEDKMTKFTPQSLLCDVQGLLSTGVLAGAPVKYKKDNLELQGILSTSGICCGCSLCNLEQVVSSLKFEKHAGSKSHNQNAHIFLENGKSLYALSKELKNVSLGSLGEVMEEKCEYPANKAVYNAWKGNIKMPHIDQKHFRDLLNDHRASQKKKLLPNCIGSFPKGPRSTRSVRPPLSLISKGNQVSRHLIFCDVDLQYSPAHKKRGVDIKSSEELYLKESSGITLADSYQSKVGDISQKPKPPPILICKNNAKLSSNYTRDRPLSTISCLLTTGLLERLLVNYKKDKMELRRCIKYLGISCGFSSRLNKVLSSMNFEKHGGTSSMNSNDCVFVNAKLALLALVEEFGKVPLRLLPGELIQKMIGFQPNNIRFFYWKECIHKNEIALQSTSYDGSKNQPAHILLHRRPLAKRLMLSASENKVPLPPGSDVKVKFSRRVKKTMKQREQDFHQQIFELLNDGTKLSYYSHGKEILEGYKFGKSILCSCCNYLLSASKFEVHAGHEKRRKPYHSIYTTFGKSLHQIAMFLLLDKNSFDLSKKELIMTGERSSSDCSPFNFRFGRIFQAPCNLGSCMYCGNGDATLNFGNICDSSMLFCGQCGRMFHVGCLRIHGMCDIKARPNPPDTWLCGDRCVKVRADLLNFVQEAPRTIPESLLSSLRSSMRSTFHGGTQFEVHWQLLSGRFQGDKSKLLLQQATKIFQEAFGAVYKGYRDVLSTMINSERGVVEFFGGMFCAVVTVKSIIVSAALLRVFGNHVAELPLAATIKERRGEGFFKILYFKIEEMLSFMNVENLILPADDHSLPMWLTKFGFINLSTEEIREYQIKHGVVMFENTTMLQKALLPI